jgi:cytochrome c-type biogenesis protein CcmH
MKTKTGLLSFILTLLAAVVLAGSVWAQQRSPSEISDDEVNAIARKIYCPVCEGIPLDTCPTLACIDWREEIRLQLAKGRTEAEIMDHFIRQYGDAVAAEPPRRGLNWLVWLAPFAVMIVGGVVFGNYLRNLRQQTAAATALAPKPSSKKKRQLADTAVNLDEYIQRIEREVDRDK